MPNETLQAILDAALRIFAKHGFAAARISDIAKSAGIGKGTVYLYFQSKEDLLIGVLESHAERLLSMLDEVATGGGTDEEQIHRLVTTSYQLVASNADLIIIIEQRPFLTNKELRTRGEELFRSLIERATDLLTHRLQEIKNPPFDFEILATAFLGMLASFPMYRALHPEEAESALLEKASEELARFFVAALQSGHVDAS